MKPGARVHRWSWAVVDSACWLVAIFTASWFRFDFGITPALAVPFGAARTAHAAVMHGITNARHITFHADRGMDGI